MRRLVFGVLPIRCAAQSMSTSSNSNTNNGNIADTTFSSTSAANEHTEVHNAPLTARTTFAHPQQRNPHTTTTTTTTPADSNETVADRVAAGRSPHLNPAYRANHQQHQQRRRRPQRTRAHRSTTTTTTATAGLADDDDTGGFDAQQAQYDNSSSSSSSNAANLPMIHPGAELPPLSQRKLTEKRVGKFSFVSDPSERASRDFYGHEVPNNTPKPKLPMWASSLTSPALGKVRLVEETWISQDARGTINAATMKAFVKWLTETVLPPDALLQTQLRENVELDLRKATARGVYAKKAFARGEVVLTIPLTLANTTGASTRESGAKSHLLSLNSEVLAASSTSAQKHAGMPDYEVIKKVLSVRRSGFDPIPHPVFIDQVHAALLLACEKAEGPQSPLYPYFQLLPSEELFDDERVKELHLGVLDPQTHMEYTEHRNRFQHYLRELHKAWWTAFDDEVRALPGEGHQGKEGAARVGQRTSLSATTFPTAMLAMEVTAPEDASGGDALESKNKESNTANEAACTSVESLDEKGLRTSNTTAASASLASEAAVSSPPPPSPPPSLEDIEWAFRVVLSRQKILPHLRSHRAAFEHISNESVEGEVLDRFGRAVMKGKYAFYQHVLRAIDEDRLHVNEVDPSAIATVVPLLDMLNHPPSGVGNVTYSVEEVVVVPDGGDKKASDIEKSTSNTSVASITTTKTAESQESAHVLCKIPKRSGGSRSFHVVVRAVTDIDEDEELTVTYTKCYSLAYTLYRYGFLALGRREDDAAALLASNHMNGNVEPVQSGSTQTAATVARSWWASLFGR